MDNAIAVLFGGNLQKAACQTIFSGKSAVDMALEKVVQFPYVRKTVLLTKENCLEGEKQGVLQIVQNNWTKKTLLETLAQISEGVDMLYFVWADTPFLDIDLAGALARRHIRYQAGYSFADGYPLGLSPEILSPETITQLLKITFDDGLVGRDAIFSVLQQDINAFDIETEIAPFDLRSRRLTFAADSRRNLLLLQRLFEAGFSKALDAEKFVAEKPEILRTLPVFYTVQVSVSCPQSCKICPYPQYRASDNTFLSPPVFERLLDKITGFSGDAVIDLSLWGELSLHPQKTELIDKVLERPALSLIIETSGIGWGKAEVEALSEKAANAGLRENNMPPISWIVSLDAYDAERYKEVRGAGFAEAVETTKTLAGLFPKNVYAQAVRVSGAEDDIERFYRFWKAEGVRVIIQKYDNFCGALPSLRVADLSPVERQPCWHLMRDMPVLIDGTVPLCRETICAGDVPNPAGLTLGNAFSEDLETIWQRGSGMYLEHAVCNYAEICTDCDEYYTYNM
jgi:spiro-SPASM protein